MSKFLNDLKILYKNGSIITKIIFINVASFVALLLISLFSKTLEKYLSVPGTFSELIFQPWSLVTYMFLHGGFMHLLMNMLWLFWFGAIFLTFFNNKQFLAVYLIGGFAGAFLHLGVNELLPETSQVGIIGASAAVMSLVFAVSAYKPDYIIHLLFIGPVKIKYLAMVAFAIDVIGLLGNFKAGQAISDGVAHFAHIGGAAYGLWFAYRIKRGKDITASFNRILDELVTLFSKKNKHERNRAKMKIDRKFDKFQKPGRDNSDIEDYNNTQKELNRILDKISKHGYPSLTKEEKEFLFKQKKE